MPQKGAQGCQYPADDRTDQSVCVVFWGGTTDTVQPYPSLRKTYSADHLRCEKHQHSSQDCLWASQNTDPSWRVPSADFEKPPFGFPVNEPFNGPLKRRPERLLAREPPPLAATPHVPLDLGGGLHESGLGLRVTSPSRIKNFFPKTKNAGETSKCCKGGVGRNGQSNPGMSCGQHL